jgi:aminoglycoside phosphotransferase (APT) family kinase protein
VIGYIGGHLTQRYDCDGELQYLYVAPRHRRKGIASELLSLLAGWFAEQEASRICVDVVPDNAPARRCCARHGAVGLSEYWMVWPDVAAVCTERELRRHHGAKPTGETPATGVTIDLSLVGQLVREQFPQWADLPIKPVETDGWDNRTYRLGEDMSVRLPSAERYAGQVEKEHRWLPRLAPLLPLPIPIPLAMGVPASGYPWHWSVYRWLEGEHATTERIDDLSQCAAALARFLAALQQADPAGGPPPGQHNFFRGGPLSIYDTETRDAIALLSGEFDNDAVIEVWETALAATWNSAPVWLHGDVSATNLLVRRGRLSAVIDFGCSGVGDPACDLTIAWTLFSGESREVFRAALPVDDATWARGRGWALWKGLITLAGHLDTDPLRADRARSAVDEVLADHRQAAEA